MGSFDFTGKAALAVDGALVVGGVDFDIVAGFDDDSVACEVAVFREGDQSIQLECLARGAAQGYTNGHGVAAGWNVERGRFAFDTLTKALLMAVEMSVDPSAFPP